MNFTVSLAGVSIAVNSIYNEAYDLCRGYLTDQPPQLSVSVSQSDIDFERGMSARESQPAIGDPYLETLAVYRKIATRLLACDTFLMHGAVIAVGQRAWLFTAPSGGGKTTLIRPIISPWVRTQGYSLTIHLSHSLMICSSRSTAFSFQRAILSASVSLMQTTGATKANVLNGLNTNA